MKRLSFAALALLGIAATGGCDIATAAPLEKLSIVVFGAPSLGDFLPPIIKAQKFDEANGLDISFAERPPDAYAAQFNSGEFEVGGSASLLVNGLAALRGVKTTYLFNLFDYWGAVVTGRPEVKTLKDLEGKDLAAAKGTTNYEMFAWFARQRGVDVSKVSVVNTATPGLIGYALADRASAVQIWEPGYTALLAKKPSLRTLDLDIGPTWQKFAGSRNLPYLGVNAHTDWIATHKATIPKLYATYQAAATWVVAHPGESAKLIVPKGDAADQKAIADLIRANDRLGLNLVWASAIRKEIQAVYTAGKSLGYLPGDPSPTTIYDGPEK